MSSVFSKRIEYKGILLWTVVDGTPVGELFSIRRKSPSEGSKWFHYDAGRSTFLIIHVFSFSFTLSYFSDILLLCGGFACKQSSSTLSTLVKLYLQACKIRFSPHSYYVIAWSAPELFSIFILHTCWKLTSICFIHVGFSTARS